MREPNLELPSLVHSTNCGEDTGFCPARCACQCHRISVRESVERARRNEARPVMARIGGSLPSVPEFDARISVDQITLRVGDRVCAAHPNWMTLDQAARLAADLQALSAADSPVGSAPETSGETPG